MSASTIRGETMQARVLPNDIDQFEDQLVEGDVYALSNFTVEDTRESYMICSNELTIYFGGQTVVEEIEDSDLIPLHSFEFVNFKDLRSRCDDTSLLTDVLGHIVYVGELQEVWKKSRLINICNARIQNLSGRDLGVTLYGDIACGFAKDMLEKGQEASVVAVFAGMRVESSHSVCSTTCSMYYLDLEIPEVQEFCANLRIQQENPVPKKSPAQKLAESWRTIEQLKSLNPEEYDEDTTFLCRVTLIDIDCSSGWCYLGCDTCQKYKLKTKVQDATGTMNLMIFCEVAEELVGVSAEELVDEIEDDDEWYSLPDELEDLLGSTHTFKVFDKYCSGSFSVMSIMDDVSVPVPGAATTQCKEELGDVSVPVLRAGITQCKEEMDDVSVPVPGAATTQCKEEMDDVSVVPVPGAATTQCKEELGDVSVPVPRAGITQCKEEMDDVSVPVPEAATTQCKEEMDDVSVVPVPGAATTQCKEELDDVSVPVPRAATTQCKEELDDVSVLVPGAATTQCKEEHVPEGSANAALPTPATAQAMEEEIVHEESTTMAEAAPATTPQTMEETVHEGSATMAEGRSKSTRLQKPNKRLRGDDWIN
ncbi:hypothetical protein HU200_022364 [Digitaria exilis]|uniref:Replication protein A 70 kDa DNA-binding subunit B/D first OB fold domain-containing protein n=1 Tax=Digitaria exilis TaxID=1010633 RepID=A0A835EYI9_9POAL|nr:hypothetical protein HU200_022364 [Digitaria exilis]